MKALLLLLVSCCIAFQAAAQHQYILLSKQSHFRVAGTSNLHDWTMVSGSAEGEAVLTLTDNILEGIEQLSLWVPVTSLKSGKAGLDRNAHKALKHRQYPNISFDLEEVLRIETQAQTRLECRGRLSIAGTTHQETLLVSCLPDTSGNISCKGSKTLQMTRYGVEPPSLMLGTIRTGDEITISFDVHYQAVDYPY